MESSAVSIAPSSPATVVALLSHYQDVRGFSPAASVPHAVDGLIVSVNDHIGASRGMLMGSSEDEFTDAAMDDATSASVPENGTQRHHHTLSPLSDYQLQPTNINRYSSPLASLFGFGASSRAAAEALSPPLWARQQLSGVGHPTIGPRVVEGSGGVGTAHHVAPGDGDYPQSFHSDQPAHQYPSMTMPLLGATMPPTASLDAGGGRGAGGPPRRLVAGGGGGGGRVFSLASPLPTDAAVLPYPHHLLRPVEESAPVSSNVSRMSTPSPPSVVGGLAASSPHYRSASGEGEGEAVGGEGGGNAFWLQWQLLPFMCLLTFGLYYTMDLPASIGVGHGNTIQALFASAEGGGKDYNQAMNQALYSVYSYPNTVLAIFGGLLIDKYIGLRKSMLLFSLLVTLGSALFYLGAVTVSYPMLVVGRLIFGLGGECLFVAKSAFVARWFRGGRGMALAFGITISFSRVGSSFNFLFSPRIADNFNVQMACVAGVVACLLSLIACIVLIVADVYAVNKGLIKAENVGEEGGDVMKLSDLLKLPIELWLICLICVFCYCSLLPFVGIAKNLFEVKYGHLLLVGASSASSGGGGGGSMLSSFGDHTASDWVSFYQLVSAAASPLVGFAVDATGRYPQWLVAASAVFTLVHLAYYGTASVAVGAALMPALGLGYACLVSGLWPCVPLVVPSARCGVAFGVVTALQNVGLATLPLIVGHVLDAHTEPTVSSRSVYAVNVTAADDAPPRPPAPAPSLAGYNVVLLLFAGAALVGLGASCLLYCVDRRLSPAQVCGCTAAAAPRAGTSAGSEAAVHHNGVLSSDPSTRALVMAYRRDVLGEVVGGDQATDRRHRFNSSGGADGTHCAHRCDDETQSDDDPLNRTHPLLVVVPGDAGGWPYRQPRTERHQDGFPMNLLCCDGTALSSSLLLGGCRCNKGPRQWMSDGTAALTRRKAVAFVLLAIVFVNAYPALLQVPLQQQQQRQRHDGRGGQEAALILLVPAVTAVSGRTERDDASGPG